jgi:hypothetical protein
MFHLETTKQFISSSSSSSSSSSNYIYAQQVVDQGASAGWRGSVGRVKSKVNPNVGQE